MSLTSTVCTSCLCTWRLEVDILSSSTRLHSIFKFLFAYLLTLSYLMYLFETGPYYITLVGLELAL